MYMLSNFFFVFVFKTFYKMNLVLKYGTLQVSFTLLYGQGCQAMKQGRGEALMRLI